MKYFFRPIVPFCLLGLLTICAGLLHAHGTQVEDPSIDKEHQSHHIGKTKQGQARIIDGYKVVRGERPPINYDAAEDDAWEPGVILIRFSQGMSRHLEKHQVSTDRNGIVSFRLEEVDRLNAVYGVRDARQYFLSPALNNTFTERHKAWGFHLWYKLLVDEKAHIPEVIREYARLKEVDVAEPSFEKRLLEDVRPERVAFAGDTPGERGTGIRWTPNDPWFGNQWHYHNTGQQGGTPGADIDMLQAWDIEKGHPDVVVAIIDDGIQYDHPDLAGNMWVHPDYPNHGYNFVNDNNTINPGNHGTHVAGTVAALSNNNNGVAGVAGGSGTGDGVRLMSCQVFSGGSSGGFPTAMIWAADNGADISQNSWGYTNPGVYEQAVLDAIDYFNENGGGVLNGGITIFAAGNSNSSADYYPGYYSGAMAVAATNNQDQKAYFGSPTSASNYGTWVDISAPGGETYQVNARGVLSTVTSNNYAYYQGTSMACPHVSGVAALLISYAHRNNYTLDNNEVWDLLVDNVDDHYPQNPGYIGELGSGRLNAYLALTALEDILSGVINPSSFVATAAGENQIDLSWDKNADNNDVLLVWSPDNIFGTPADGTTYSPGQTIPGGGTVLYRGSNTSFEHTGLDAATTYYYKAFSYNAANEHSSGRTASASTDCAVVSTLPFTEDFNDTPPIPLCWEIVDHQGNGQVWQFGTHSNGLDGATGNYAYLNSDAYGSGNTQNADLVTPVLDLSGYADINLSFTHYFRQYQSASTATLSYSTDGGNSWTQIQQWTATIINPTHFDQVIEEVAGEPQVRFKWNYTGTWGYYWDVDDVEITGTHSGVYADFSAAPTEVYINETVTFTDSSGGGEIVSWSWDFGDGADPATITGQGPHEVTYATAGEKTVSLTVNGEATETKTGYITVNEPDITEPFGLEVTTEGLDPGEALFSWMIEYDEFRYDDGVVDAQLGFPEGTWNSVMGAAHHNETVLYETTWYLTDVGSPQHNTVKVWVLGLDANGMPDRDNVLYTAENIPNTDNEWNTYMFTELVEAPDGFFIGLSYDGFLGLAVDDGVGEPWDFVPGTQFAVFDITDPSYAFNDISFWDFEQNFLLRAYGINQGDIDFGRQELPLASGPGPELIPMDKPVDAGSPFSPAGHKAILGFNVFLDGNLVEEEIADTEFLFTDLAAGSHTAGVQAVYSSGTSEIVTIGFEMEQHETEWIGAVNNDWDDAGNWSAGAPYRHSNATIPGGLTNNPTIDAPAEVGNLTLEEGATLLDRENLTIHGGVVMKREIPFGGWQFIAAPVNGMNIIGSDFVPDTDAEPLPANFDFYSFDESASSYPWINIRGAGAFPNPDFDQQFIPGKGYLVAYFEGSFASNPFSFSGDVNTGDINIDLGYTPAASRGWNLIGNPYPSGIDWSGLDKSAMEDVFAYIYDRDAHDYIAQEGGIIAANQGFFVKADGNGTLNLTNDDRTHGGAYSKGNDMQDALVLRLTNDTHGSNTTIRIVDGAEFERDRRDALKLFSFAAHMPQIYSYTSDAVMVAINSMPFVDTEQTVNLGIRIPAGGQYNISVSKTGDRFSDYSLYLEDMVLGNMHYLTGEQEYVFFADEGDDPMRFGLHFRQPEEPTGLCDTDAGMAANAWYHNNMLYVQSDGYETEVAIYDISGRRLRTFRPAGPGQYSYPLNLTAGIYILHVSENDNRYSVRIAVK